MACRTSASQTSCTASAAATSGRNPYQVALHFCMEQLHTMLSEEKQHGRTVHVIFESRGRREDRELELEFRRIAANDARRAAGADGPGADRPGHRRRQARSALPKAAGMPSGSTRCCPRWPSCPQCRGPECGFRRCTGFRTARRRRTRPPRAPSRAGRDPGARRPSSTAHRPIPGVGAPSSHPGGQARSERAAGAPPG